VRFRRKRRFDELVDRQLDLFATDDAELLAEAAEAASAWNSSAAETAEEAYGDYQLVVDAIADRLLDIRESYAHSLDEEAAADEYRDTFTRTASRRYRRYATLLADLDLDED
jgi:NTP pyrophosphatase (non-canonical NTP hydrolase)